MLTLIDDPDMLGRLTDLRVLVTGFIELSVAALAPSPPPPPPPPVVEAPPASEPSAPAAPQGSPSAERIFGADEPGVTGPVVIRQQLPRLSPQAGAAARARGLLEVVIDEQGRVISAAVHMPVHPTFDQALVAATRDWSYTPATLNGQPVKFRKMIQVVTR